MFVLETDQDKNQQASDAFKLVFFDGRSSVAAICRLNVNLSMVFQVIKDDFQSFYSVNSGDRR